MSYWGRDWYLGTGSKRKGRGERIEPVILVTLVVEDRYDAGVHLYISLVERAIFSRFERNSGSARVLCQDEIPTFRAQRNHSGSP